MRNEMAVALEATAFDSVKIECVHDEEGLRRLQPDWDALWLESSAGLFCSWAWLYPWYRHLGSGRELYVLTARDATKTLVGIWPLAIEHRRVVGRSLRRLAYLGETHVGSDYLDVVARRGEERRYAGVFARALQERAEDWDVADLLDFDESAPSLLSLRDVFAQGYVVRDSVRCTCPFEAFTAGETWDAFLKRTLRRETYLRRKRWLEKQPGYEIEIATEPNAVKTALEDFFRLHAMRWAEEGGSRGIQGPTVESFHREATQQLAQRGQLRLYTLRVGRRAVASVYGIVERDRFLYYQSGYDPEWRPRSVGLVLLGRTFQDALEGGMREFDFLRGTEPYKSEWSRGVRRTLRLRVHPLGGRGGWLTAQERARATLGAAARRVLSSGVRAQLKRLLRR